MTLLQRRRALMAQAAINWQTASGAVAAFTSIGGGLKNLIAAINPVQSGTGDASPTNVRPISGWSSVNVTRCGKNLLDDSKRYATSTSIYLAQNTSTYPVYLKSGVQYTFSVDMTQDYAVVYREKNGSGNITLWNVGQNKRSATFTVQKEGWYRFVLYNANGVDASTVNTVQIEVGTSPTTYEAYNSNEYSVSIPATPGTVYGGTLDVVKGVLTVNKAYVEFAVSDMNNLNNNYPGWYGKGIKDIVGAGINGPISGAITDISKSVGANTTNTNDVLLLLNTGLTQTEWKETYGSLTAQFVLPMATPVTYQLTPQQISVLAGYNTVWADSGDVSVTYKA